MFKWLYFGFSICEIIKTLLDFDGTMISAADPELICSILDLKSNDFLNSWLGLMPSIMLMSLLEPILSISSYVTVFSFLMLSSLLSMS